MLRKDSTIFDDDFWEIGNDYRTPVVTTPTKTEDILTRLIGHIVDFYPKVKDRVLETNPSAVYVEGMDYAYEQILDEICDYLEEYVDR